MRVPRRGRSIRFRIDTPLRQYGGDSQPSAENYSSYTSSKAAPEALLALFT